MGYTHLEVHSHFTFLGATASPTELAERAAAEGLARLALTDAGVLSGAVAFRRACEAAGVQPVIGLVVPVLDMAPGPKTAVAASGAQSIRPGRLVLLARNVAGYRSLCRLSSLLQGAYGPLPSQPGRQPGLTWDELRAHRDGLVCLSGGCLGWIDRYLRAGDRAAAQSYAGRLAGVYGDDACLALQLAAAGESGDGEQAIARETLALGQRLGLPVTALQPVYALGRPSAARLPLLAAIRLNCRVEEVAPEELPGCGMGDGVWLSREEMAARFAAYPSALAASEAIAARCGQVLPGGRHLWPAVPLPPGQTPDQALAGQAQAGLIEKYGPQPDPAVAARLAAELAAIGRQGYAPLFLVVADLVRFARQHSIPVSTRGSVANSLAAYCAGITDVDPVAHELLFERFLSPARIDSPDIDVDLCSRRRDEVLAYAREAYGAERVALVGTVSTLRLQSALRETAKAYGLDETETGDLMARVPRLGHRTGAEEADRALDGFLAGINEPRWQVVVQDARALVGQPDHMSIHAGGLVITPGPLTDVLPVQMAPKGFLVTQYEHGDVETLGLPKIDLLGIRALTVLADTTALVQAHYQRDFRLESIPQDDPATGDLLERGETIGVFQCESDGARATLRKLRARSPRDLAIANAFFKPGPSTGGMARAFVLRYRGEEAATYLHPALEPILSQTRGVLIFQEQVLRIATELAGLSWQEADHLRRGMGRMRPSEMADLQERFVAGCQRLPPEGPGLSGGDASRLWEQVSAFAGFGFNQGHATAYAAVTYRSAYLRAHWPAAFLCARLADFGGFHHPAIYMAEAVRLGLALRPPHVNHSGPDFTLEANPAGPGAPRGSTPVLWMGLGQVRDLRTSAVAAIVAERSRKPFAGLQDLLNRLDLQAKEVQHLVCCGALDGLAPSRAALLAEAETLAGAGRGRRGKRAPAGAVAQQLAFDFALPQAPEAPEVSAESAAQRCAWEQAILGVPLTAVSDPLALLPEGASRADLPAHAPLARYFGGLAASRAPARPVAAVGLRLPGWTGGPGFFLWDGSALVTARLPKTVQSPPAWRMVFVRGHVAGDEWGTTWLQAQEVRPLFVPFDTKP